MVDDGGGDSAQGREIAQILDAFQQKDDRKKSSVTLDQRLPKSHLLGSGREVFGQFARMGDGLETRVGCSLDGSHRHGLLHRMWGRRCQSVMEYRTARDERLRGSENKLRAQSRLLGVGSPDLCKEGNARKTLRRGDESCSVAPLGSYGRFYMNLCAIPACNTNHVQVIHELCYDSCAPGRGSTNPHRLFHHVYRDLGGKSSGYTVVRLQKAGCL